MICFFADYPENTTMGVVVAGIVVRFRVATGHVSRVFNFE